MTGTTAIRDITVVGASLAGLSSARALRAEGYDGRITFVGAEESVNNGKCALIFARHGDQYFLKQSQCASANASFFIPTSGLEKKAVERAAANPEGELYVIAMK